MNQRITSDELKLMLSVWVEENATYDFEVGRDFISIFRFNKKT